MSAPGLTARQRELLAYLTARETCPSYEEMQHALGLSSKSAVSALVNRLEERGCIRRLPNRARSIEVIRTLTGNAPAPRPMRYPDTIYLPLHGRIH